MFHTLSCLLCICTFFTILFFFIRVSRQTRPADPAGHTPYLNFQLAFKQDIRLTLNLHLFI